MDIKKRQEKKLRRRQRVRAKITGTSECPRLSVFRSHRHISAQLINDDVNGSSKTLAFASSAGLKGKADISPASFATLVAKEVGKSIAEKGLAKKIKKVIFDRGGYKYHGKVKALAEGAREGGLQF